MGVPGQWPFSRKSCRAGVVIACVAVLVAACASDDEKPKVRRWNPNGGPSRSEDWHSPVGMLMRYDLNHDGTLTRKELETGLRSDFDSYDKDHTGCLTGDQVTQINESRLSTDESAASPLIDWQNHGCVDFEEFAAVPRSLFEDLDKNGDGKLTPDELHPHAQKKKQPPPAAIDEGEGRGGSGRGGGGGGRGGGGY